MASHTAPLLLLLGVLLLQLVLQAQAVVFLGSLAEGRGVQGRLAALSRDTLLLTRFSYSGQGSDTVFLVGTSGSPGSSGLVLPYPSDPSRPKAYRYYEEPAPTIRRTFDNEDVVLKLPDSITADKVAWLSIWSKGSFSDLGSVFVPPGIDFSPLDTSRGGQRDQMFQNTNTISLGALSELRHKVKGNLSISSPSSLLLQDFSYDGLAPTGFFIVGTEGVPGDTGRILSYPESSQSYSFYDQSAPIIRRSFNREDVTLTLPPDIPADQIAWFSVWCRRFKVPFGSVTVNNRVDMTSLNFQTSGVCPRGQECVHNSQCQDFQRTVDSWQTLSENSPQYNRVLATLRARVCQVSTRRVCCPN